MEKDKGTKNKTVFKRGKKQIKRQKNERRRRKEGNF